MGNYFPNRKTCNKSTLGVEMTQFNPQYVRNYIVTKALDDSENYEIECNDLYIMHLLKSIERLELTPISFTKKTCSVHFEETMPHLACDISIECFKKILELECYVYLNNTKISEEVSQFTTKNNVVILKPNLLDKYQFFLAKHIILYCFMPDEEDLIKSINYVAFVLEKNIDSSITINMVLRSNCNNLIRTRYAYRMSLIALLKKCSEIEINSMNLFKYISSCCEKYPYNTGYMHPLRILDYKMNITFENEYNPNYKDELAKLSICDGANFEILDQTQ